MEFLIDVAVVVYWMSFVLIAIGASHDGARLSFNHAVLRAGMIPTTQMYWVGMLIAAVIPVWNTINVIRVAFVVMMHNRKLRD